MFEIHFDAFANQKLFITHNACGGPGPLFAMDITRLESKSVCTAHINRVFHCE